MSFDPETEREMQFEEAVRYLVGRAREVMNQLNDDNVMDIMEELSDIASTIAHFSEDHAEAYAGYDYYRTQLESKGKQ